MQYTVSLIQEGVPTVNGRIYTKEIMEEISRQAQRMIAENRLNIKLGYPPAEEPCGKITNIALSDGQFHIEYDLVKTNLIESASVQIFPLIEADVENGFVKNPVLMSFIIEKQ